jgi:CBS domain-containing protein
MIRVKDILKQKGNNHYSTTPHTLVFDALVEMADKEVGALIVIDKGTIVGMFSERDYARKVALKGKTSKEMPVSEAMTIVVHCVSPEATTEECMAIMTDKKIRHLPVLERNELVGVVSIGDVVNSIIQDQKKTIEQLGNYISAGYGV